MSFITEIHESTADAWNAVEDRKHGKHHPRGANSRSGSKPTLLDKPVTAIDGEGLGRIPHKYVLLEAAWRGGSARLDLGGTDLPTKACFDFLLDLPDDHVNVVYGASYDMNMWVRDLPLASIERALDTGRVRWMSYEIYWIERKLMRIKRGSRSIVIYDVLANWQCTFVKACEAWHVGTAEELAFVTYMKQHRDELEQFDSSSVQRYCGLEVELLVTLTEKLLGAIRETGYRPNAIYGPGALAAAALKFHHVKDYYAPLPDEIAHLPQHAYFGGRFDVSQLGWFLDVWQYDIKSAYPDQIRNLPCLKHATWVRAATVEKYGLYHVDWRVPGNAPWPPFPHRYNGEIFYHTAGAGWYHGDEVLAAIEFFGKDKIRVTDGWTLLRGCEHRPFDFVDALFNKRKHMEYDQGIVLKLILNSLYGKLAQQVGTRPGKPPPFQNFYYAGAITAGTRAKILRGLARTPRNVIAIATDSLVSLRELDGLEIGSELGMWDLKHIQEYAQISNGVYHGVTDDGKEVERSRGLERTTLDWDALKAAYRRNRGNGTFSCMTKSRFYTHRMARQHPGHWRELACTWRTEPRDIKYTPARRMAMRYYTKPEPHMVVEAIEPEWIGRPHESEPFKVKTGWNEANEVKVSFLPQYFDWQDQA